MRGLDTPVLLDLLRGRTDAHRWVRSLAGGELATTELNLLELTALARRARGAARERRLGSLAHLRRSITVLPIDERATARAATMAAGGPTDRYPWGTWAMAGALVASGCEEWVTRTNSAFPPIPGLRVTVIGTKYPQTRQIRDHKTGKRK